MPRPKKAKVEAMPESGGEDENKENESERLRGIQGAPDSPPPPPPPDDDPPAPHLAKLQEAVQYWEDKSAEVEVIRKIVTERQKKLRMANRLCDAKMKRLDNGDKRKRRKFQFRAACRTYEAIIELNTVQLKTLCAEKALAKAETAREVAHIAALEAEREHEQRLR